MFGVFKRVRQYVRAKKERRYSEAAIAILHQCVGRLSRLNAQARDVFSSERQPETFVPGFRHSVFDLLCCVSGHMDILVECSVMAPASLTHLEREHEALRVYLVGPNAFVDTVKRDAAVVTETVDRIIAVIDGALESDAVKCIYVPTVGT